MSASPSVGKEPSSLQLLLEIALVLLMSAMAEAQQGFEVTTPPGPTSGGGHDARAGGVEIERGGHPTR
jgi:hypothetical protein